MASCRLLKRLKRMAKKKSFENIISNLLGEPVSNMCHAFYDQYVEANVKFRSRAGMKTLIIRRQLGKCCKWCADLAGIYTPENAPADIYKRHDNCKCMVTYKDEDGYTDVWTKQKFESQREARVIRDNEINGQLYREKRTNKILREYYNKADYSYKRVKIEPGVKKKKEENAIQHAYHLHRYFGGDITVLKDVNKNGIKTPDYLWNGRFWEHKTFTSLNSAYKQVKKGLLQIEKNPGGLILQRMDKTVSLDEIENKIIDTMNRYSPENLKKADVFIFEDGKIISALRWKKKIK